MSASLDLEQQLVFYGAYHNNKINKMVHFVCVPIILATAIMLATNTPALLNIPYFPLNLGAFTCLTYVTLYLMMEPVAGGLLAPILIAGTIYGNKLTHGPDAAQMNKYAIGLFLASWIFQFVGHGKFEGRAPALFDNLFQAFFLAPFFVWFELLFALGYRPELKSRVENKVHLAIAKFRASKKTTANIGMDTLTPNGKKANGKA